jgi:Ser/Thr protein kinase RdoA (MazF antagonist)
MIKQGMTLNEIRALYGEDIRKEAFARFGADPDDYEELEGSAPVYRCNVEGLAIALKVTPGFMPGSPQIMGSTIEQINAEIDFVRKLATSGAPVAAPVRAASGEFLELITPGTESDKPCGAAFFAYATEMLPGELLPDDDVVIFPPGVVSAWGAALGMVHRISGGFTPIPGRLRLHWLDDDTLDPIWFQGMGMDARIEREYQETMEAARELPVTAPSGGLCHGDPHHGNFMWHAGRFTFFDFDACCYGPFTSDIAEALYNCLPMPREATEIRRTFAREFLDKFITAYRTERALPDAALDDIPLLLKLAEVSAYGYYKKYWTGTELTERRRAVLAGYERRIAEAIPVVDIADCIY